MYYLLILLVLFADQLSKAYIYLNMNPGQTIPLIEGIFHITYVRNTGAAFSILQDSGLLLKILPIVFIIAIIIFLQVKGKYQHWTLKTGLSLVIAGGLGNLIDRMRLDYVVDMFDFRVFPVFNVADIAVCTGCALIFIYVIFFEKQRERIAA